MAALTGAVLASIIGAIGVVMAAFVSRQGKNRDELIRQMIREHEDCQTSLARCRRINEHLILRRPAR